jgi:hypothetical protein
MGDNRLDNKPVLVEINAAVAADVDAAVAADSNLALVGFTWNETDGTPALCEFYIVNGPTGATATKVVYAGGVASSSGSEWFGDRGIPCPLGLSIDHVSGTINVSLFYKVLDNG